MGSIELAVTSTGSGPTLIFLHGIGVDWRVWQAVARRLAPQYHLVMPDLRGHGASDKPRSGYGLADYALDIELLVDRLELRDVTLVGSSLGGIVAAVVEAAPEVVSARVLVDPPLRRGSGPQRTLFEAILHIKQSAPAGEQRSQILRALEAEGVGGRQYLAYLADTWTATATGVLEEALSPSEPPEEIEDALRAIEVPTLIMRANPERGGVLSSADAERAAKLLRLGELRYYGKAGHAIHGSMPAEFTRDLVAFRRRGGIDGPL